MILYKDFAPTAFDSKGAFLEDEQQTWFVAPVSITRDTPDHDYGLSNWHTVIKELEVLDPNGNDYQVHRFGHWGPGWFEIIVARPQSKACTYLDTIEQQLEYYPILDENDYSEREFMAACDSWKWLDLKDRVQAIDNARCHGETVSTFAARSDDMPQGITWETHSDGIYFC